MTLPAVAPQLVPAAEWFAPASHPPLRGAEVHLWRAPVAAQAAAYDEHFATLDAPERARAGRFHFASDRHRFVAAHGILRQLLGRYVGESPERLAFDVGPFGKPALSAGAAPAGFEFNLSHAGDLVLVAVAKSGVVGVDVERWDTAVDYDGVAGFCFSPCEQATLRALTGTPKAAAFFAAWTRKEAYIKATGFGISQGLDYFDVTLTAGVARLLNDRRDPGAVARYRMRDLTPGSGYSAAVAFEDPACSVRCFSITDDAGKVRL